MSLKKFAIRMRHEHAPAAQAAKHTVGFGDKILTFSLGTALTSDEDLAAFLVRECYQTYFVAEVDAPPSHEPIEPEAAVSRIKPRVLEPGEVLQDASAVEIPLLSSEPIAPEDVVPFLVGSDSEEDASSVSEEDIPEADAGIPEKLDIVMPSDKAIVKVKKARGVKKAVAVLVNDVLPRLDDSFSRDMQIELLRKMILRVKSEYKAVILEQPRKKMLTIINDLVPKAMKE